MSSVVLLQLRHPLGHEVDGELVRAHHDGRVRDLPKELDDEAAVEADAPLLLGHGQQRGPEGLVLGAVLAQPGAGHLWKREAKMFNGACKEK